MVRDADGDLGDAYKITHKTDDQGLDIALDRRDAPLAQISDLKLAHSEHYILELDEVLTHLADTNDRHYFDPDTVGCPATRQAMLRAAGTAIAPTDPLVAPLTQGQKVGNIDVTTAAGTKLASVPLVVLQAVPESGLLGRAWDSIRLWIK